MLTRNSRGRPKNAPAAFYPPCRPTVAQRPPSGPGWAHELKHDGYRLQIHVRDGRVRLYTMNAPTGPRVIRASSSRPHGSKAQRSSMPRSSASMPMAWRSSRTCTAVPQIVAQSPARSTCSCSTAMTCDVNHLSNAKRYRGSCCVSRSEAFNSSNIPRATAPKCSQQLASLALRASCQNG
jgi:hypothetical protein